MLSQPATFGPPDFYPVERAPYGVAAGDLNGDGTLDLVTANRTDKSISVLLGVGDGTFSPATSIPVGDPEGVWNSVRAIALGDVDGDGYLDAVVSGSSYEVYTLLGAGDGSLTVSVFRRYESVRVTEAREVELADLDRDGALDLVMATDQDLIVYIGDGTGNFALSTVIDLDSGFGTRTGLAVGDLDGDGAVDVAAGNGSGTMLIARNDGTGKLLAPILYARPNPTPDVVAADLDGDGDLDLATPYDALLNDGSGTFAPSQSGFTTLTFLVSVDAADFDLDGAVDLALTNASDQVSVVRGRGDGTFVPAETYAIDLDGGAWGVAAPDLNNDRKPDLVVTDPGTAVSARGQVAVLLNDSPHLRPLFLPVEETIGVVDEPRLMPALFLPVEETITVSDSTAFLASLLLRVEETITVSDTTASVFSVDTEAPPPTDFALGPAYPNPVAHAARLPYALPEAARVRLDLYDALGRRVATLVDAEQPAGRYVVRLPAAALANGAYVVRLEAGPFVGTGVVQVAR